MMSRMLIKTVKKLTITAADCVSKLLVFENSKEEECYGNTYHLNMYKV